MSEFLYQLAMNAFSGIMRLAALFSPKVKLGVTGREGLLEKLEKTIPALINGRPVAWFHAASLGEFEQGRPVMESFKKDYPDYFILLTFFSPSGYEVRKNYGGADYICYLPVDTENNARRFVALFQPKITFFIKYEFWFNYLSELKKSGSYILSFSTIFRSNQLFFKSYGGFYRKMLAYFDHLFVQNDLSLQLMHNIGINQCSLAGDTRFDRVYAIAQGIRNLPEIAAFKNDRLCMVAGSVWEADMQVLIPALNKLDKPLKVILAPHEINTSHMESWRKQLNGRTMLYSEYKKAIDSNSEVSPFDYLIIDNIGMLSSLYSYGDIGYIGGSFGSGLHNILEAATFGMPILFGDKKYQKFQEANDLIDEGSAKAIANTDEAKRYLTEWISDNQLRNKLDVISKNYVISRIGATEIVMKKVRTLLR